MRDFHRILLSSEVRDLTAEVGRLFEDLERTAAPSRPAPHGHCAPTLDVIESDHALEIVVDVPGVPEDRLRILFKGSVLIIAGEKCSPYAAQRQGHSFHLVERGFGRFVRAVRLEGAFDGGATTAVLRDGELHVVIPKLTDRRGQEIAIPVTTA
jgi:HSP20 family protein